MANRAKFTPEIVENLLTEIVKSGCIKTACAAVNIRQSTFYNWLNKYTRFAENVEKSKEEWRRSHLWAGREVQEQFGGSDKSISLR
jgi:hypothetical protein